MSVDPLISIIPDDLAVQEVGGHEQFQGDFWSNGKLWDLSGAVGEANFVCEEHTNLLKDV